MKTKAIQFGLTLLSLLFVYHISYADGVYIPTAKKKIPDIPVQRALVKYRAGTEALIVESTLNGEGGDYGWIIPVPNPPKKFEKVSPGLLKTLSLQIQPKIHHVESHAKVSGIPVSIIFTILIVFACFCSMRWGTKGTIISLTLLVFFIFFILPNLIAYRSSSMAGPGSLSIADSSIEMKSRDIVGNYEVFVLEAGDSAELNTWLDHSGFSKFPPKATQLIDDYISHGWCFVVAKIRTTVDGIATPHPILLEFETDRPVYPMKLTAIPGSTVYLELYVVGKKEAIPVNYSIKKEYCNFFDYGEIPRFGYRTSDVNEAFIPRRHFPNMPFEFFKEIAHSDATTVMWDGCVVTKFTDTVSSSDMMKDMFFEFKEASPFQAQLYSSRGKFNKAYHSALNVLMIGSILLTLYFYIRKAYFYIRKDHVNKVSIVKLFIILLISGAIGFGVAYESVGKTTDVYLVEGNWHQNFYANLADLFSVPSNDFSNGSELIDLLQRNGIDNPITGEPIIIEHSPGNMIVEKSGDKIEMKICLENGSLYTLY